jgi:MFS family permease
MGPGSIGQMKRVRASPQEDTWELPLPSVMTTNFWAQAIDTNGKDDQEHGPYKCRLLTGASLHTGFNRGIWSLDGSQTLALFFAALSLAGLGLATANYWALTQTLVPGKAMGRIAGIQNCASNLGGVTAPILTGWFKERSGGYEAPMQVVWVVLLSA